MNKNGFGINNQQCLMHHKPNQIKQSKQFYFETIQYGSKSDSMPQACYCPLICVIIKHTFQSF